MKNQTKLMAVLSAAAILAAAAPNVTAFDGAGTAYAASKGWTEEAGSLYYLDEDGYRETSTWKKKGSDWYYLNENGEILTNQKIDEYYVNDQGVMVKNQWVASDSGEEYDSPDSPDASSYHYYGKDGKIVSSKWLSIDGKTYYFNDDGQMMTGLTEIEDAVYYLGGENDGSRKTGWLLLEEMTQDTDYEGSWCYFDENGKMVMDQFDRLINGKYYTFIDGQMQTGWVDAAAAGFIEKPAPATGSDALQASLSDFRYYDENEGGKRASGWYTIEGAPGISEEGEEFTFFFKNGEAYHSSKPGLSLFTINSQKYAFNEKGEMQTGLKSIEQDGKTANYYFNDNGVMQTGKQTIYNEDLEENQIWYFIAKGSAKGQGHHGVRDNQVYVNGLLQKADPELRYEPVQIGEKRYLVNTSGTIQKAGSSSASAAKPELGKGFKDVKDSNDTIWTVDTSGYIQ